VIPAALMIRHAAGTCPVYLGAGLLRALPALVEEHLPNRRLAVIADHNVASCITAPIDAPVLTFPAGEPSKTRETWSRLTDQLLARHFGRDSAIIALGGGVTGDLAGFVAATYLRGVPVLQVPTSLLAMLDASVGGKTGVDTPAGKNLVGAFHQPVAVVVDPGVLATLPEADLRAGLAEAVKHALIADATHFAWLDGASQAILTRDLATLEELLRHSIAIKVAAVEADESDRGRRAVLNAGHTIAHALEAATGYAMRHGEAVAIGLVVEARLGEGAGFTAPGTAQMLAAALERFGLPTRVPAHVTTDMLFAGIGSDKKNQAGALRFSFPARIGAMAGDDAAGWTQPASEQAIRSAIDDGGRL
jgi:3-dehydroquinate synthase